MLPVEGVERHSVAVGRQSRFFQGRRDETTRDFEKANGRFRMLCATAIQRGISRPTAAMSAKMWLLGRPMVAALVTCVEALQTLS